MEKMKTYDDDDVIDGLWNYIKYVLQDGRWRKNKDMLGNGVAWFLTGLSLGLLINLTYVVISLLGKCKQ